MEKMVTNLANSSKWIAYIPLSLADPELSDVEVNLVEFHIPPLEMGKVQASFKGQSVFLPGSTINATTKENTLTYLINDNWDNYYALYKWTDNMIPQSTIMGEESDRKTGDEFEDYVNMTLLPIRIFLLNEFKKPQLKITYNNCWITTFGEVMLNFQNVPAPIQHQFTFAYTDFRIEKVDTLG